MENTNTKPKRMRNRAERISQSEKNQVAAGVIMQRLRDNAQGKLTHLGKPHSMSPSEIKAAELFLSKTVPSLSAVEQTNINEADNLTPEQLMATMRGMLENSQTRRMLKDLLAEVEGQPIHEVKNGTRG